MDIEYKSAEIVYKPCCSNCGYPINTEVSYRNMHIKSTETKIEMIDPATIDKELVYYAQISPCICHYCGAQFHGIMIENPKKLPSGFIEAERDPYYGYYITKDDEN